MAVDAQEIKLNPQYLTDSDGNRQAVMLTLAEYRQLIELLEDYLDLQDLEAAKAEETSFRPFEEVLRELELDKE